MADQLDDQMEIIGGPDQPVSVENEDGKPLDNSCQLLLLQNESNNTQKLGKSHNQLSKLNSSSIEEAEPDNTAAPPGGNNANNATVCRSRRLHHSSSSAGSSSHSGQRSVRHSGGSGGKSRSQSPQTTCSTIVTAATPATTSSSSRSSSSSGLNTRIGPNTSFGGGSTFCGSNSAQELEYRIQFELGPPIDAIGLLPENFGASESSYMVGLSPVSGRLTLNGGGQPQSIVSGSGSASLSSSLSNTSSKVRSDTNLRAKKSSWYNALYPTYKSRSEDFKKIFTALPQDERLIVEYSCALQKDILVHGRLYVTKNYVCFYANIFRWETSVALRWKDVVSLTKEKTALVIPNAIQVGTESEKHFFTSFAARDKAYVMLFKLWQNALLDQPASAADIWQWVHSMYGDELGLTSDDELDYVSPYNEAGNSLEVKHHGLHATASVPANLTAAAAEITQRNAAEMIKQSRPIASIVEESSCIATAGAAGENVGHHKAHTLSHAVSTPGPMGTQETLSIRKSSSTSSRKRNRLKNNKTLSDLSADDISITDDSDMEHSRQQVKAKSSDEQDGYQAPLLTLDNWRSNLDGRELTNEVFPINVDQLFTLLFTNSKFYLDFHSSRKTFDISQTAWQQKTENGSEEKVREVSFTLTLTHPMGPKHSQVTETQVMHTDSRPGQQYIIDIEVANAGIPYADSFYVTSHFFLTRITDNESRMSVIATIKYKKTVWGLVKTFIEKNTWSGLEDFYTNLTQALHIEAEQAPLGGKAVAKSRRSKKKRLTKPRGSISSKLSGSKGHTSGEEEEDEEEEEAAEQMTTSIKATAVSSSHHEPGSSGPFSDMLIKIILILLSGLLMANSVLFYKMWELESRLALPLGGLDDRYFDPSEAGAAYWEEDQETWLKLLQRQEAAHQLELQKWHDLLGTATGLLRQTEQSLTNLQRSIHPLAMQKLKSMLKIQDEWNHLKEHNRHEEEVEHGERNTNIILPSDKATSKDFSKKEEEEEDKVSKQPSKMEL